MKFKIQTVFGLLVLVAGCAAHKDKIVFSDDAEIRAAAASAVVQPAQKKLDKAVTAEDFEQAASLRDEIKETKDQMSHMAPN